MMVDELAAQEKLTGSRIDPMQRERGLQRGASPA